MNWRRVLWILIIIVGLILVFARRVEILDLLNTLRRASWPFLLAAILAQFVYFFIYTWLYQMVFNLVGVRSRMGEIFPVLLTAIFVENLAPSAGFTGASVFIDDAVQRGESGSRAAEGVLLVLILEHLGLLPILVIAIFTLIVSSLFSLAELLGIIFFLLYLALFVMALFMALLVPGFVLALLSQIRQTVNLLSQRLKKRDFLPSDWAIRNFQGFQEAARTIILHPQKVGQAWAVAAIMELVNLAGLEMIFLAFRQPVDLGVLTVGYSFGFIAASLSFLPFDVGITQAVMILVYDSLGVPLSSAIVVSFVFGGLNTWLPVFLGFFLAGRTRTFGGKK